VIVEVGFTPEKISNTHQTVRPKEWWSKVLKDVDFINK